jgi:hypothetical protein
MPPAKTATTPSVKLSRRSDPPLPRPDYFADEDENTSLASDTLLHYGGLLQRTLFTGDYRISELRWRATINAVGNHASEALYELPDTLSINTPHSHIIEHLHIRRQVSNCVNLVARCS